MFPNSCPRLLPAWMHAMVLSSPGALTPHLLSPSLSELDFSGPTLASFIPPNPLLGKLAPKSLGTSGSGSPSAPWLSSSAGQRGPEQALQPGCPGLKPSLAIRSTVCWNGTGA